MIKTYGINGIVEASYLFKAGNGNLRANFSGGVIDERRTRPATLTTQNQVAMLILEHTDMFRNGEMFIVSQNEDPIIVEEEKEIDINEAPVVQAKATKPKRIKPDLVDEYGGKIYESVTSVGEAVNVLMSLGAKGATLTDPASIIETASSFHVSFPNLSMK